MAKITVINKQLPGAKVEALLFTETQWTALKDHIGKAERRVKELAEELKVKESRKKCSEDMTKKWENTFVNLRKKRLEAAVARVEREKTRKYERFLTLQSEQSKKKEALRKLARDNLYEEKDHAKSALCAYKFAEVLRERELQIAFNRKLKETEEEREKEWDRKIIEDVELFNKEEAEKNAKALEKKRKLGKMFVEKLRGDEERKRKEKEARKAEEREAMELNKKEIKEIEKNERLEMESRKRSVREQLIHNRQEIDNRKKIANAEEKEEAAAVSIIANAKAKLAKIRKEKDAELKSAAIKRREKIAKTLMAAVISKEDEKEAIYQKDKARNEELALKRIEKDANMQLQMRQDRIDSYNEFLRQEAMKKLKKQELMKWEMLQRLKKEDVNRKFTNVVEEKKRQITLEIRNDNFRQAEEKKLRRQKEIDYDDGAVKKAEELWEIEDQEYFNFVAELKKESIEVGRPVFPLDNEICAYKKRTGLLEIPPQHRIFQSNVPIENEEEKVEVPKKKDLVRTIYTKVGNTANPVTFEAKRTPITFVKDVHHANGLQDQIKKKC